MKSLTTQNSIAWIETAVEVSPERLDSLRKPRIHEYKVTYRSFQNPRHLIFANLGAIYGAVHATSWTGHFPTPLEQVPWQVAVWVVIGGDLCIFLLDYIHPPIFYPYSVVAVRKGKPFGWWDNRPEDRCHFCFGLVIKVIMVAFSAARGFLVVQAFISLPSPPV